MIALVCLGGAVICALIARVLLLIAALEISVWWAIGVFLPFGPTLFRLSYPEAARSSFLFRMATLGCIFLYVVAGPGAFVGQRHSRVAEPTRPAFGFASEIVGKFSRAIRSKTQTDNRTIEARRIDNAQQFERLAKWAELLRRQKQTLLPTDAAGAQSYAIDLQEYNAALTAATTEKQALTTGK
jgi:hypothetical protein